MSGSRERAVVFACGSDTLLGVVHEAAGRRGVLIMVGGPQYRVGSHRQFVLMARAFAAAGFPVLRFDYRGMGDSDGEPRSFEAVADDIRCAIEVFARESAGLEEIVLWGLCDAASTALMCCDDPRINALILANPWVRNDRAEARSYLKHYYSGRLLQRAFWEKVLQGKVNVTAALGDFLRKIVAGVAPTRDAKTPSTLSFIDRMRSGFERFKGPVLILMSGRDLTAQAFRELAASDAQWQRALARPHVRQIDLPAADHTFSARRELDRACEYCLSWLREPDSVRSHAAAAMAGVRAG